VQQISFNDEVQLIGYDVGSGQVIYDSTFHNPVPPALGSGAQRSARARRTFFGAVGPILGDRWRIEADPTYGTLTFVTGLVDYRKYVMPIRPFTIAGRFLHIGRYGNDADDPRMYPMFIGYPSLIRGYDIGSFHASECGFSTTSCPVVDQLFGSRIMVASLELRFPLFGVLGAGGGYYGILPIEAALFYDAGVAWTGTQGAEIFGNGPRQVYRSAGASLRMNLFGHPARWMTLQPFQRPERLDGAV
jgi:outer membrane protein assembly factor BamA